jgi:hypothetical protein
MINLVCTIILMIHSIGRQVNRIAFKSDDSAPVGDDAFCSAGSAESPGGCVDVIDRGCPLSIQIEFIELDRVATRVDPAAMMLVIGDDVSSTG